MRFSAEICTCEKVHSLSFAPAVFPQKRYTITLIKLLTSRYCRGMLTNEAALRENSCILAAASAIIPRSTFKRRRKFWFSTCKSRNSCPHSRYNNVLIPCVSRPYTGECRPYADVRTEACTITLLS